MVCDVWRVAKIRMEKWTASWRATFIWTVADRVVEAHQEGVMTAVSHVMLFRSCDDYSDYTLHYFLSGCKYIIVFGGRGGQKPITIFLYAPNVRHLHNASQPIIRLSL